jgi:hypothetical protein
MAQAVLVRTIDRSRRDLAIGIFFLALAVLIILLTPGTADLKSTFVLESRRAGVAIEAPDLILPTTAALYVLGLVVVLAGGWQLIRGFRRVNLVLSVVVGLTILAFLVWATRDKSLNMTGMLVSSLVRATPIALAALCGIYS